MIVKYLIRRTNGYVTPSGSDRTETRKIREARIYRNLEQAELCRSDWETLVPLHEAHDL